MKNIIALLLLTLCMIDCSLGQTSGIEQMVMMTNKQTLPQETDNGVKAVLPMPAEGWTPFLKQDMDQIWSSIGLRGVNYYCVGKPEAGKSYSERSDFKSKFYQSWFGTYIIEAKKQLFEFPNEEINSKKRQVINQLMKIGILDQSSWLYAMGDKAARNSTTLTDSVDNFAVLDHLSIDGQTVPMIKFSLNSHSDLTDSATQLSSLVGMPDKSYWKSHVDAYHNVVLIGFFIYWYNKTDQTLRIIYGTGCSFSTKDKTIFNTYPLLMNGMLLMAKELRYTSPS